MSDDLPCPCCGSDQIQLCSDANNPVKDLLKCRVCKIQGPRSSWNQRPQYKKWRLAMHGQAYHEYEPDKYEWVTSMENVLFVRADDLNVKTRPE